MDGWRAASGGGGLFIVKQWTDIQKGMGKRKVKRRCKGILWKSLGFFGLVSLPHPFLIKGDRERESILSEDRVLESPTHQHNPNVPFAEQDRSRVSGRQAVASTLVFCSSLLLFRGLAVGGRDVPALIRPKAIHVVA